MAQLNLKDAQDILNAIKSGTPPPARLIHHIHVGRQRWLEGMAWYLDAAKNNDLSSVRFIIGEYGSGKTHFLRMTAHMALERRFVICEVTLSDVRLDRFDTVWTEMMKNLATPESQGEPEEIKSLLNRWCEEVSQSPNKLQSALTELDGIPQLDPDFRQAIRGYLRAWIEEGDIDRYLQWFKGDPVRPPGVRTRIDRANSRAMLRSLIQFLRYLGYSGLLVFVDELELIMVQNRKARDSSYDVLRQFIDNASNLRNFLLLCSATPSTVYNTQLGFPSYDALWQRLGGLLGRVKGDYRAITVNLDDAPLSDEDLFELAKRLRTVHSVALRWQADQAVPDDFLRYLISVAKQQSGEIPLPRLIVQVTVSLLESKQQNPDETLERLLPDALIQSVEIIRYQEQKRFRRWEKE